MINVISHTSALEAMRLVDFPKALVSAEVLSEIPSQALTKAEAERWASSDPLLRGLARPIELLVADPGGARSNEVFRSHALSVKLPAGAALRLSETVAIVRPELMIYQIARRATTLELVMLIDEICGLYAAHPSFPAGMLQRKAPLSTLDEIRDFADAMPRAAGTAKVRAACGLAVARSGSPMESRLAARISWSRLRGGYGLSILSMNEELVVDRISRRLDAAHVRKPDILFSLPSDGEFGYCLDYHGWIHDENGRAEADSLRANELLAFGLQPFSIWRSQYESTSYMDGLIDGIIRPRLGLGAHRPRLERRSLELARREALLSELDTIDGLSWGVSERAPRVIKAQEDVEEAKERLAWAERHLKRSSR